MITPEILHEKGFYFEQEENGLFQRYVKQIDENVDLVIEGSPEQRIFVYIFENQETKHDEGVCIILDVDDIDFAIKCAIAIVGVE